MVTGGEGKNLTTSQEEKEFISGYARAGAGLRDFNWRGIYTRWLYRSGYMKWFFAPNIQTKGRVARAITALFLGLGALICLPRWRRLSLLLFAAGLFTVYEVLSGWCVLRACGIKTKL
jgi:hypothetical protein